MELKIIHGNIFSGNAEALILTIDGSRKGMEGNLARQFAAKYADIWEEIESTLPYPLPLGQVFLFTPSQKFKYKNILIISILNHAESLDSKEIEVIVMNAFSNCLNILSKNKIESVSSTLIKGGWRLDPLNSFLIMSNAFERKMNIIYELTFKLYIREKNECMKIKAFSKGIGW